MDAVDLLKHDHRMVEQLFTDYQAAANQEQARAVVEVVIRELSKHAALEELMIYPLAKKVLPDGQQESDEHLKEHMAVKKILIELDGLSAGDNRQDELIAQLKRDVEHHVQEEEQQMLPNLRDAVDQQTLNELGEELDKAKQTAPTRPHPHAPDEPPGLTMAGPVAAIYDRFRDRVQGRPRT